MKHKRNERGGEHGAAFPGGFPRRRGVEIPPLTALAKGQSVRYVPLRRDLSNSPDRAHISAPLKLRTYHSNAENGHVFPKSPLDFWARTLEGSPRPTWRLIVKNRRLSATRYASEWPLDIEID